MKWCLGCKQNKPLSEFGVHTRTKDGLRARCKLCERKPPRHGECARCGLGFDYWKRGPVLRICPACQETHHWCHACLTARPHAEFYNQAKTPQGLSYRCKQCTSDLNANHPAYIRSRKAHAVRQRYGITLEAYESYLLAADGVCPICLRGAQRRMVLDHDHRTGAVRGVICYSCNSGIGMLADDLGRLERAVEYLKKAGQHG